MENVQPLVSVCIPTYNRPEGIIRTLECMLAQTYANLEIVVSDNASPDPQVEKIMLDYASRDARIRYYRQPENKGGMFNFMFVFKQARGGYFTWAADDDEWTPDYIQSLVVEMEKDPNAIFAFSPYQLVEEETGKFFGGAWRFDYQSRNVLFRLIKFTRYYSDMCIYGLIRKSSLNEDEFVSLSKPWAWINADLPYNTAHPLVYFLLSKGNFRLAGDKPLLIKSVTTKTRHHVPFQSNLLMGYFAHVIRKINLLLRSAHYIYLGSRSILLVLLIAPFLLLRLLYDCITPVYAAIYIWLSGKKISDLSPHEIWRLGVR